MLKLGAATLVIAVVLLVLVMLSLARRRAKTREEKLHQLYLRSKKRDWLARWLGKSNRKRLTYRRDDAE
ncbi:hypothetical protein [Sphingomonas abietis]|uniref:Uncharacterized protein n=1 Tax=Sphingomonas abietis TaxID=3012344 RepID=A0ABY7NUV8_9SPHN|nr:hypothetical protein [Sphingomonas abietis]WBO24196.1 hypothetical protein PBT88_08865 [Sphingomonas abietis]